MAKVTRLPSASREDPIYKEPITLAFVCKPPPIDRARTTAGHHAGMAGEPGESPPEDLEGGRARDA